jgi:hypothetical protein
MKTETGIAEELSKEWLLAQSKIIDDKLFWKTQCRTHLASCQRFLEFLEKECVEKEFGIKGYRFGIGLKIKDLQNAIKTYEDAGIK